MLGAWCGAHGWRRLIVARGNVRLYENPGSRSGELERLPRIQSDGHHARHSRWRGPGMERRPDSAKRGDSAGRTTLVRRFVVSANDRPEPVVQEPEATSGTR